MKKATEIKIIWGFIIMAGYVALSPIFLYMRYRKAKKLVSTLNTIAFCHSSQATREKCRLWIQHNLGSLNTRAVFFNLKATEKRVARFV